ncbi:MAG: hypothetical protein VCA74_02605 [Deltaproteobacteria bacterium]
MKRLFLFTFLFLVLLVWTFPYHLVVEGLARHMLSRHGVELEVESLDTFWPPLMRMTVPAPEFVATGIRLSKGPYALNLSTLHLKLGLRGGAQFESDACGGQWRARYYRGRRFELNFTGADPADCLELDGLRIGGHFGGTAYLRGLGRGDATFVPMLRSAVISVDGHGGSLSGHLPGSSDDSMALGQWEFAHATVEVSLADGRISLDGSHALAQGIQWQVTRASLGPGPAGQTSLQADFRARRDDDSSRSRAVIAMLPKATEADDGWRRYRVHGTVEAPNLIGLR